MTKEQLIDALNTIYAQLIIGNKVHALTLLYQLIVTLKEQ